MTPSFDAQLGEIAQHLAAYRTAVRKEGRWSERALTAEYRMLTAQDAAFQSDANFDRREEIVAEVLEQYRFDLREGLPIDREGNLCGDARPGESYMLGRVA